jgi:hypothetical protein
MEAKTLTWEDIRTILTIADRLLPDTAWDQADFEAQFQTDQMFYEEVLRRFLNGDR